jgi:hypothetical protein
MVLIILFNGGNSKFTQWYTNPYPLINPIEKTNLVSELEKIADVFMYNPIFNFDSGDIEKFANSDKKFMFELEDLNLITHCENLYKKINSQDKFILMSHSRGYIIASIFASVYSDQIIGYVNLDGGLTLDGVKKYIDSIPDYSTITNDDLKKIFEELSKSNTKELRNKLADIVKYFMYNQYKWVDFNFNKSSPIPVYVFNNIYHDEEINLLLDDYVKTTLIDKVEYNMELSKSNPNVHSIYYVGLTHWFYFGKESDIIDSVKKILGWKLCEVAK